MVNVSVRVLVTCKADPTGQRRRTRESVRVLDCHVEDYQSIESAIFGRADGDLSSPIKQLRYLGWYWESGQPSSRSLVLVYCAEAGVPASRANGPTVSREDEAALGPFLDQALRQSYAQIEAGVEVDCLLVQPFFPLGDREAISIPLGLAYIASSLEQAGQSLSVLDCNIQDDYDVFCNLAHVSAKVVGIQFHSAHSWDFALKSARRLREIAPSSVIVAGGELASIRASQLLSSGLVDYVAPQEGEQAMVALLDLIRRGDDHADLRDLVGPDSTDWQPGSFLDLDRLPDPAIDAFRWWRYGQWSIMTSRGCPYRCTYCSSAAFWHHRVRYHSIDWILRQFARMAERGARDVYIADDTFTVNERRTWEFSERMARESALGWSCLTRVDRVNDNLLAAMARGGCRQISFGYETASAQTLDLVSKRTTPDQAREAIKSCHRAGIRTRVSVIVGLPGETARSVRETIRDLEKMRPNEVQVYALTPHDGTTLFANADSLGLRILEKDPTLWTRDVRRPVCETRELSSFQISALGTELIQRLAASGYEDLTDATGQRKRDLEFTVGTAFTPVQAVRSVGMNHDN